MNYIRYYRRINYTRKPLSAFSLIEVIIAVGILGLAIPAILGMLTISGQNSTVVVDHQEAAGVLESTSLYLRGQLPDANASTTYATVANVLSWRNNSTPLYAYRQSSSQDIKISTTRPTDFTVIDRRLYIVILSQAPGDTSRFPDASSYITFQTTAAVTDAYLPMTLTLYAAAPNAASANLTSQEIAKCPFILRR